MSEVSDKIARTTNGSRGGLTPEKKAKLARIKPKHRAVLLGLEQGLNLTKAMIAAGYTPNTAAQTDKLQRSRSWQALMEEQLPESLLTLRHRELLDKRVKEIKVVGRGKDQRIVEIDMGPDVSAVKAGLEMAYKLRGKFNEEARTPTKPAQVYNLFYQKNVQESVSAFEDTLKKAIAYGGAAQIIDAPRVEDNAVDVQEAPSAEVDAGSGTDQQGAEGGGVDAGSVADTSGSAGGPGA